MKKSVWIVQNVALVAGLVLVACAQVVTPTPTAVQQPTAAPATQVAPATQAPVTGVPTTTLVPTSNTPAAAAAAAPVTLSLWHAYASGSAEETAITRIVAQYMKDHPDMRVNVQRIASDQIINNWQSAVAGGTAPDMFTAQNDNLGDWARAGIVAAVDQQLAGKLSGISQTGIDGVMVDGKIYAVPGIIKAVALFYNKTTVANPPATTDELLALVRSGKKLVLNQDNYYNYGFFPAFGGQLMDGTGKCIADQGGYADAMTYLLALKTAGATFQSDRAKADSLFETGAADMIINGPWVLADYEKALGGKLGVAAMPTGPKGPAKPLVSIDGFYFNPKSQNTSAAIQLTQYIFGKDGLAIYANLAGDPPARTDVTVSDALVRAFADAASAGTPRPQSKEFANWWGPFGDMVNKVVEGRSTPANGVKAACDAMNKANKL